MYSYEKSTRRRKIFPLTVFKICKIPQYFNFELLIVNEKLININYLFCQVVAGGNYDVDMELLAPSGRIIYKDSKKQYDSHTWTTDMKGEYKFCFSNEFSTFTHKIVYFDLQIGDDQPLNDVLEHQATAMTQVCFWSANYSYVMLKG